MRVMMLPHAIVDPSQIRRTDRLGGLIHEYDMAA
jgi:hypothetical protein